MIFGFIISIEALNTRIEKICDFTNPDYNKKIGLIKDVSEGAVYFAVIASLIAIVLIYYPYLF
jgi:diacylglycerol kinase (ATP)